MRPFERLCVRRATRPPQAPRDVAPFALAVLALVFALWLVGLGYAILGRLR